MHCSIALLVTRTEETEDNKRLMGPGQGEITHQLSSWANRLGKICFTYHQSKQRGMMKNNPKSQRLLTHPSLFYGLNFTPNFLYLLHPGAQRDREWGLWLVHHMLYLMLLPPQRGDSSCSSPAPVWSPSYMRWPFMVFSN